MVWPLPWPPRGGSRCRRQASPLPSSGTCLRPAVGRPHPLNTSRRGSSESESCGYVGRYPAGGFGALRNGLHVTAPARTATPRQHGPAPGTRSARQSQEKYAISSAARCGRVQATGSPISQGATIGATTPPTTNHAPAEGCEPAADHRAGAVSGHISSTVAHHDGGSGQHFEPASGRGPSPAWSGV